MHKIDEPGVTNDAVFHRQTDKDYPTIVRGKGAVLFDADGKEYIDAAGGIFVVNIGHGVAEIGQAMAQQAERFTFAHTAHFTSEAELDFASRLTELAPPGLQQGLAVHIRFTGQRDSNQAGALFPSAQG